MHRDRIHLPVWEIDPAEGDHLPDWAECEALFLAAYAARFPLRATRARVRPYLVRYFGYGIVAPWVQAYLRRQGADHPLAEFACAPLDPCIDWRGAIRWSWLRGWRLYLRFAGRRTRGRLRA